MSKAQFASGCTPDIDGHPLETIEQALAFDEAVRARVDEAIESAAYEMALIWSEGDGYGGALLDRIAEILQEAGHTHCHTPRTREPLPGPRKARIHPKVRKEVMERDKYRCRHCGDHRDLSIDHIHPECQGGPGTPENLQVLCMPCNLKKGAS